MALTIIDAKPPSVLKHEGLQQELNIEGIVKFPFLTKDALKELSLFYYKMHPTPPSGPIKGFYVSVHSPDLDYKIKIQNEVNRIIYPFLDEYFKNYKLASTAMLVKSASPESELVFHQDWNACDETKYRSYTLWIPLIDTTIENGALFVAKRTHRIGPTFRSASLPFIYSEIGSTIAKYLVPFEAQAGTAILFDKSILHQSPPNFSKVERPTIVSTVLHQQSAFLTYTYESNLTNEIFAYEVANDYIQHYKSFFEDAKTLPDNAQRVGEPILADFKPVTAEEFEQLYFQLL